MILLDGSSMTLEDLAAIAYEHAPVSLTAEARARVTAARAVVDAFARGDQPAPMTAEQLGRALRADTGITGAIVDPAGPWIRLSRADLGAIISG